MRITGLFLLFFALVSARNLKESRDDEGHKINKRFILHDFSVSKMFNAIGTAMGSRIGGSFVLLKNLYDTAFSTDNLLFKRKLLNFVLRAADFLLRLLPAEPVRKQVHHFQLHRRPHQEESRINYVQFAGNGVPSRVTKIVDFVEREPYRTQVPIEEIIIEDGVNETDASMKKVSERPEESTENATPNKDENEINPLFISNVLNEVNATNEEAMKKSKRHIDALLSITVPPLRPHRFSANFNLQPIIEATAEHRRPDIRFDEEYEEYDFPDYFQAPKRYKRQVLYHHPFKTAEEIFPNKQHNSEARPSSSTKKRNIDSYLSVTIPPIRPHRFRAHGVLSFDKPGVPTGSFEVSTRPYGHVHIAHHPFSVPPSSKNVHVGVQVATDYVDDYYDLSGGESEISPVKVQKPDEERGRLPKTNAQRRVEHKNPTATQNEETKKNDAGAAFSRNKESAEAKKGVNKLGANLNGRLNIKSVKVNKNEETAKSGVHIEERERRSAGIEGIIIAEKEPFEANEETIVINDEDATTVLSIDEPAFTEDSNNISYTKNKEDSSLVSTPTNYWLESDGSLGPLLYEDDIDFGDIVKKMEEPGDRSVLLIFPEGYTPQEIVELTDRLTNNEETLTAQASVKKHRNHSLHDPTKNIEKMLNNNQGRLSSFGDKIEESSITEMQKNGVKNSDKTLIRRRLSSLKPISDDVAKEADSSSAPSSSSNPDQIVQKIENVTAVMNAILKNVRSYRRNKAERTAKYAVVVVHKTLLNEGVKKRRQKRFIERFSGAIQRFRQFSPGFQGFSDNHVFFPMKINCRRRNFNGNPGNQHHGWHGNTNSVPNEEKRRFEQPIEAVKENEGNEEIEQHNFNYLPGFSQKQQSGDSSEKHIEENKILKQHEEASNSQITADNTNTEMNSFNFLPTFDSRLDFFKGVEETSLIFKSLPQYNANHFFKAETQQTTTAQYNNFHNLPHFEERRFFNEEATILNRNNFARTTTTQRPEELRRIEATKRRLEELRREDELKKAENAERIRKIEHLKWISEMRRLAQERRLQKFAEEEARRQSKLREEEARRIQAMKKAEEEESRRNDLKRMGVEEYDGFSTLPSYNRATPFAAISSSFFNGSKNTFRFQIGEHGELKAAPERAGDGDSREHTVFEALKQAQKQIDGTKNVIVGEELKSLEHTKRVFEEMLEGSKQEVEEVPRPSVIFVTKDLQISPQIGSQLVKNDAIEEKGGVEDNQYHHPAVLEIDPNHHDFNALPGYQGNEFSAPIPNEPIVVQYLGVNRSRTRPSANRGDVPEEDSGDEEDGQFTDFGKKL